MKSALCLILDENANNYLPLYVADNYKIDKYTMNFENASQLRECYEEEINEFLNQHPEEIRKMCYRLSVPKFNGWIVVLQNSEDGVIIKKALFKKHKKEFSALCHDKKFMRQFIELEERLRDRDRALISEYVSSLIENSSFDDEYQIRTIKNEINRKKNKSFYELLRLMLKLRRFLQQNPDINFINYNDNNYIELIRQYNEIKEIAKRVDTYADSKEEYYVDGVRYTQEEQELFDLDDLAYIEENEFRPDGLGQYAKRLR